MTEPGRPERPRLVSPRDLPQRRLGSPAGVAALLPLGLVRPGTLAEQQPSVQTTTCGTRRGGACAERKVTAQAGTKKAPARKKAARKVAVKTKPAAPRQAGEASADAAAEPAAVSAEAPAAAESAETPAATEDKGDA